MPPRLTFLQYAAHFLFTAAAASAIPFARASASPVSLSSPMWNPLDLHIFIDTTGLASVDGLQLVQHQPAKTYEMAVVPDKPWDGGGPMHGAIAGYCSVVQVSPTELRLYYDTFGQFGRFLCVAVSTDGKPYFLAPRPAP